MLPIECYIKNPRLLFSSLLRDYGGWIPDKPYLQMMYYLWTRKQLNLKNPQTFGEKIQWLKLYNRKPEYTTMVDKYAVKDYVAKIIGEQHIIPTIGVWEKPEDIDFDSLPQQFVLKTTHGGGGSGIVICKDKCNFDKKAAVKKLKTAMRQNIYKALREWPYKNIRPRIIAEKYLVDQNKELTDYKVHVFGGQPQIIQIDYNRFICHHRILYDSKWNRINAIIKYPTDENKSFAQPSVFRNLLELAKKLSKNIPYIRTDFYIVGEQIYFGELTFFHGSGYEKITPQEFDYEMGSWIELPPNKNV